MRKIQIILVILCITINISVAQNKVENYHWQPIAEYPVLSGLPDPFLKPDGRRVKSIKEWPEQRNYIIAILEHYQYGTMPPVPKNVDVKETFSEDLFDGIATRKLYTLTINRNGKTLDFHFGLIKPKGNGPFPVIIKNYEDAPNPTNKDKSKLLSGSIGIPDEALLEALKRGYIYCAYNREDLGTDIQKKLNYNVIMTKHTLIQNIGYENL